MLGYRFIFVLFCAALGGCALLYSSDVQRDRAEAQRVAALLKCGMTETDVNAVVGGKLEKMGAPHERLTHIYRLPFANLWLVFDDRGLRSSQVLAINGLTSYASEQPTEYCVR
jgi:hypothetical protein